jgi:hypothetical protein
MSRRIRFPEYWEDLRTPANTISLRGVGADPDWDAFLGAGDIKCLRFDGAGALEEVQITLQLPHSYSQGTDLYPHVHWVPVDANAGNVRWSLEYSWANIDAVHGASTTIHVIDAAAGTAWTHQKAYFAAITGTGKEISSMFMARLYRDSGHGDDTYASDAALLEFDIHYQLNALGSENETTKLAID